MPTMHYELKLAATASGVGYFSAVPATSPGFDEALGYLRAHPADDFMHKYLLEMIGRLDESAARMIVQTARGCDALVLTLMAEASLLHGHLANLSDCFEDEELRRLAQFTPLVYLGATLQPDADLHRRWMEHSHRNIVEHRPFPPLMEIGLPSPVELGLLRPELLQPVNIAEIAAHLSAPKDIDEPPLPGLEATAQKALAALESAGKIAGEEMRHAASLSPVALLRRWKLDLGIRSGSMDYTLTGIQTSYGRGFSVEVARASCAMEMVERCSSFAGFSGTGPTGYAKIRPLYRARYSDLKADGTNAVNPMLLGAQIPATDELLHWLEGETGGYNPRPVMIPAQCVFLFCNLDETALFSGLGSTGLASGNIMEQAKVAGLLEVLERDAEAVTPFDPSRCFRLTAEDPQVAELLEDYRAKGISVQFMDMTTEFGVPCAKCFVVNSDGEIVGGTGAHLNGRRAALSALTETTYPYPDGPASAPGLEGLPYIRYEDLPDHSTGSPAGDLELLEAVLERAGYRPVYVDLTRKDLGFPVVRAFIPGLEPTADFDRFSRVSARLYARYLRMEGML